MKSRAGCNGGLVFAVATLLKLLNKGLDGTLTWFCQEAISVYAVDCTFTVCAWGSTAKQTRGYRSANYKYQECLKKGEVFTGGLLCFSKKRT